MKGEGYDIGAGNRKKLIKSLEEDSTENVTLKFSKIIERPNPKKAHNDRRVKSALEIYNNLMQRKHGGMVMRNYYDYEPRSI